MGLSFEDMGASPEIWLRDGPGGAGWEYGSLGAGYAGGARSGGGSLVWRGPGGMPVWSAVQGDRTLARGQTLWRAAARAASTWAFPSLLDALISSYRQGKIVLC